MLRDREETPVVDAAKDLKRAEVVIDELVNRAAIHVRDGLVFERVYNRVVDKEGVRVTKYIDARCMFAPQYTIEIPIEIWEQVVACVEKKLEPRAAQLPVFPTAGSPPSIAFPPSAIHLPAEPPIADRPIMGRPSNPIVKPEPPKPENPIAGAPPVLPTHPIITPPEAEPRK
jgi:hypothetical protein